jgi:hypothetical protein
LSVDHHYLLLMFVGDEATHAKQPIMTQKDLSVYFKTAVSAAQGRSDQKKAAVAEQRKTKGKGKGKGAKKVAQLPTAVREEARWLDTAERQDKQAATEGKLVSIVPPTRPGGRTRKLVVSSTS